MLGRAKVISLGALGLVFAALLGSFALHLVNQPVGLNSEPLTAGDRLIAPSAAAAARAERARGASGASGATSGDGDHGRGATGAPPATGLQSGDGDSRAGSGRTQPPDDRGQYDESGQEPGHGDHDD